jgi:monoterpene epsilon-lactone hydrolase
MTTVSLPPLPDSLSAEAHAQITAILAAEPPADMSLSAMREQMLAIQRQVSSVQSTFHAVDISDGVIEGVPVRIFEPKGGVARQGVLLNAHGGGFMFDSGSLSENVPLCALTGMKIVAVLYRMAPEHPYPAAVDDMTVVYRSLVRATGHDRVAVYGTSAGAALSAQTIIRLKREGLALPAAVGFFSGSADFVHTGDSEQFVPMPGGASSRDLVAPYVAQTPRTDPGLSPLYADLSGFPPTLLISSTRDQLLSQTAIFHRALLKAQVPAQLVVFEGLPHAFWAYVVAPESTEAFELMATFLTANISN